MANTDPATPAEVPVSFRAAGGELEVELTCGQAQMGTYTLRLWSPDGKTVVQKARGSYVDEEEDRYPLPKPNTANDKRLLQCRSRIWLIQGNTRYAVFMTVKQGGTTIGEASLEDQTDESSVIVELRIRLVQQ